MWVPKPSEIVTRRANGLGNMGDVTDRGSTARFFLAVERFAFVFVRGTFSSGTGDATLSLKLDHRDDSGLYDALLFTFPEMGTDTNAALNFRIAADELYQWGFHKGDELVFEWTNPDAATMQWALEVGLADASE